MNEADSRRSFSGAANLRLTAGVAVLCLLAVGLTVLYVRGLSGSWEPVQWSRGSGVGAPIERAKLANGGTWLVWVDATFLICAYDLENMGSVTCLDPGPCMAASPVGIVDGSLIALRTLERKGALGRIAGGWRRLFSSPGRVSARSAPEAPPGSRTTRLEKIDLDTGRVLAMREGFSAEGAEAESDLTDFEVGSAGISPDNRYLAWWKAREISGTDPLAATVVERFDLVSLESGFGNLLSKEISTGGSFSVRTSLLGEIGKPFWGTDRSCFFISFLGAGSLVPVDCQRAAVLAAVPLSDIHSQMLERNPHLIYGPEGFCFPLETTGQDGCFAFWARQQDSLHFFRFNSRFEIEEETTFDIEGFRMENPVWLERSFRFLLEDPNRRRLVAYSMEEQGANYYPLPPDWEEGFEIVGEDSRGALVGTNGQLFMRVVPGGAEWETIEMY